MSKEVKKQESEAPKSNKKYVALAIVVILGAIGIMINNSSEEETIATTIATTEQVPVEEQTLVAEEPTIARIDITTPLVDTNEPQFKVYVDDSEKSLNPESWLSKFNRLGYIVQKNGIDVNITIEILNNIDIEVVLRGPDKRDANNKIIENWVDYTSVLVNGEEILPTPISVWHNKPFTYTVNAKAGEIYKLRIAWQKQE